MRSQRGVGREGGDGKEEESPLRGYKDCLTYLERTQNLDIHFFNRVDEADVVLFQNDSS